MTHRNVRKSPAWTAPLVALTVSGLLALAGDCYGAPKKSGMVDYGAPVRVRVKKPASASEIDPQSWQVVTEEMSGEVTDGKQVEAPVRRQVSVPKKIWSNDTLDQLPGPAWDDCKKKEPRYRHLDGPHGRISAGIVYRDFGDVEFDSKSSLIEHLDNKSHFADLGGGLGEIEFKTKDMFDLDKTDAFWQEDVDAGGPYMAFDLLFPVSENWQIGQQTSFSYSHFAAANSFTSLEGQFSDEIYTFSGHAGRGAIDNKVSERLEADVYTIGLGPIVEFHAGPVFAQAGGGLAINIVQYGAQTREELYITADMNDPVALKGLTHSGVPFLDSLREDENVRAERWEDGNYGTKVLFGYYLQGLVGVQLSERWSLSGFARYDWNQPLEGEVGESTFRSDLDALSLGGQVGFGF